MPTFFFHSGMVGAPTNTNAAGSTLGIIRACLVGGFNVLTPSNASVTSEVMTITYSSAHGYENLVWIRLDGAVGGSIVKRATVTSPTTLTIEATGFSNGPVSGTLSTRVAPADWEEAFTDTNIGVFRSKVVGPGSTRFFYRVADTALGTEPRMIRGFESMTNANTGVGPFPTVGQEADSGVRVHRPTSGAPNSWAVVADGRTFYMTSSGFVSGSNRQTIVWFGDEQPIGSIDSFCAAVGGGPGQFANTGYYRPRNAQGSAAGQTATVPTPSWRASYQPYPAPIELGGGLVIVKPVMSYAGASATSGVRSVIRGAMAPTANPITSGVHVVMDGISGVQGRVVFFLGGDISAVVVMAFAIDEDWA